MALDHAIDHRQAEARSALALGGEKRLQAAALRLLVHARPGVANFQVHERAGFTLVLARNSARADRERASVRHRVHGIEDEIGESVADFALSARERGQAGRQLGFELDDGAPLLRHIAPTGARQVDDLPGHAVEIDGREGQLRFAPAIKLTHTRDRLRHIFDGALDGGEVVPCPVAQAGFPLQQRFGVERDRGDRVVDVVGDAAGHLAQHPQPLLLHDRVLGLAEIVIGFFQRSVKPGLMRGHRDVLAQLPEKLALAAAEAMGLAPGRHDNAEHLSLDQDRRRHERTQPGRRQPLRERKRHLADVRLVNQLAAHAAAQTVLVNRNVCLLGHGQLHR